MNAGHDPWIREQRVGHHPSFIVRERVRIEWRKDCSNSVTVSVRVRSVCAALTLTDRLRSSGRSSVVRINTDCQIYASASAASNRTTTDLEVGVLEPFAVESNGTSTFVSG